MDTLNCKCPACGAALEFNSQTQNMKCASCGAELDVDAIKEFNDAIEHAQSEHSSDWGSYEGTEWTQEMNVHNCPSCGAQIVADATTSVTKCPYCDNVTVIGENLSGAFRPDCVIPFKIDKKTAKEKLAQFCKGKKLLPGNFLSSVKLDEVQGLYVPFWLFDCDSNGTVFFDATKTRAWCDSRYNYTQTSHYSVVRGGNVAFDKIPVDGSEKMDDAYMESVEPFDYSELKDFNAGFLSGYVADKYDVDEQASKPRATNRVKNSTVDLFRQSVTGYDTVTLRDAMINITSGKIRYALLPVWMLHYDYGNKHYTYAVNGQTGKITGKLPVSMKKFWIWLLSLFVGLSAVGSLFMMLFS